MCYRDLTKPMGALNPERLNRLKERFDEMGDPRFVIPLPLNCRSIMSSILPTDFFMDPIIRLLVWFYFI